MTEAGQASISRYGHWYDRKLHFCNFLPFEYEQEFLLYLACPTKGLARFMHKIVLTQPRTQVEVKTKEKAT
jgi:hypothetical protein